MRSYVNINEEVKRVEKRVFGKDITNLPMAIDKKVNQEKHEHLQLKYIPNVKVYEQNKSFQPTKQPKQDAIHDYTKEILQHMLSLQKKYKQEPNEQASKSMRQILIDWLIDVHLSFGLKEQTLHLALGYLNEFEAKGMFTKEDYQLVGITCLWIASKFQEIYPPRMANYVDVTANTYTLHQMRRMQQKILQKLNFNLCQITTLSLLQAAMEIKYQQMTEIQKKSFTYAKYILQLSIIEGNMLQRHTPSKLVSPVLLVCNSVFKTKFENRKLQEVKSYSKQQIYQCYKEVVEMLRGNKVYGSDAIKRKYQQEKYFKVGKLKVQLKGEEKVGN